MNGSAYQVSKVAEFEEWLNNQSARSRVQILKRLLRIRDYGHFGDHKSVSFYDKGALKDTVWELRWDDGKRIYYAYVPEKRILLLLGGNKNGQNKDVSKAKNIYLKITEAVEENG